MTKLPGSFWAEAQKYSNYVHNRVPSSATPKSTPYAIFTGKKPSLKDIGLFGCDADVVYEHKRKKFESRTYKAIYLGPAYDGAGSRFFKKDTQRIIISRNFKLLDRVAPATPSPPPTPIPAPEPAKQQSPSAESGVKKGASSGKGDKNEVIGAPVAKPHAYPNTKSKHTDRKSTRLNSSHSGESRMPSSA